ncbi:MAG TPA: transporter substrate-binding domain-containing protein [Bacteroidales bacterium]|jgi:membrane-bound lytic murein transglycosylase F|nr:transporter substrate-binding domain-containing protein [Bacteroidales bacterium]OQC38515.1 MAG: Membrane-bound lytic murein transglycosylase F precursor [Bacteroidetes bacterium ADurb.Bin041]MBP7873811.1 transporter substrate-binding domain-containing protein [Bacteroidales bacterium]MCZ2283370.1 transporter substrate-binding domain-containing protein [Bacteroidales bacterium]HNV49586.1 transporter substrate-binding domain-containing protein [Bacteroidales bacterium]
MKYLFGLFFFVLTAIIPPSCTFNHDIAGEDMFNVKDQSLNRILERGTLRASTVYNSIDYFIYRSEPAGYQYELLSSYARYLGVNLEIVTNQDVNSAFQDLWSGRVDVIAQGLSVTGNRKKHLDFTYPLAQTHQVLIQRKEGYSNKFSIDGVAADFINSPLDLAGKIIFVPQGSSAASRLRNLQDEIGGKIYVVEYPYDTESLISMVATGKIDYTVCDDKTASVNQKFYPHLDTSVPVSFSQNIAWAVNIGCESLKKSLDEWLEGYLNSANGRFVYNKYFIYPRSHLSEYSFTPSKNGKFSPWDDFLRSKSANYDFDWRLVASLIYEESQFQPDAISVKGAFGLMQFMPETAEKYKINFESSPEEQIEAGLKYLSELDRQFKKMIKNKEERIKFVLAAYNSGIAHVLDARRLAKKYDRNPNLWDDNVDYFMKNKSNPEYFTDSVVQHGYSNGVVSFNFVNDILNRYEHYKNVIE